MKDLLGGIGVLLIIGWLVGFFGFGQGLGGFIHILLVLAILAILIRIIKGRSV